MRDKRIGWLLVTVMICAVALAPPAGAAPSVTNPLCYKSQAYRNTHEQECLIDQVKADESPNNRGGRQPGGLLESLTGGLLGGGGLL